MSLSLARILLAAALWFGISHPGTAAGTLAAQAAPAGAITVDHAWARATATVAKTGAAYFSIVNKGSVDDRLVAASSPVSNEAQLHQTIEDHGVMKMRPLPALEVKAGATVTLVPGKMHLMLVGLKAPLKLGQTFPVVLTFEKAGSIEVMVTVEKPGAGNMDHAMPGMTM